MNIVILTFQGFNELDSFITLGILNRAKGPDWKISICCPEESVTSMNGVTVQAQALLEETAKADVVIVGSGRQTRSVVKNVGIMSRLTLDPSHQLIAAQCSGALILSQAGILQDLPACTDLTTKPWMQEAGVEVLNQAFFASGNIATAGGCLSSSYLAAWVLARTEGIEAAKEAIHYVAPVGEKEHYVASMLGNITEYLPRS
ncbi:DJ-1/PfpI family protein [Marinomonas sp. 2405UD68-3]|uniref:DJ-1/PfpI family protein n=1 Tax=Marinomonas sp. 2405UD68-3 TaxID=3391835 RepID=UPI0039C99354